MKRLSNVQNNKRFTLCLTFRRILYTAYFHTLPVTEPDTYSTVTWHMLLISASNENETAMLYKLRLLWVMSVVCHQEMYREFYTADK